MTMGKAILRSRGLTMIELLVVIAIGAILVALAGPSMRNWLINQRVASAASELVNSFNYARSEAVQSQQLNNVEVYFPLPGRNCYSVGEQGDSATYCDCTRGAGSACAPLTELRTVQVEPGTGVSITKLSGRVSYNKLTGQSNNSSPATIEVAGSNGNKLNVKVAARTGRPQVCSVGGTIPGYPIC